MNNPFIYSDNNKKLGGKFLHMVFSLSQGNISCCSAPVELSLKRRSEMEKYISAEGYERKMKEEILPYLSSISVRRDITSPRDGHRTV